MRGTLCCCRFDYYQLLAYRKSMLFFLLYPALMAFFTGEAMSGVTFVGIDLEGLNEDGRLLIDGYAYKGKDQETATGELVERAIHMGYLSDGDTVSIAVSSSDADWQAREEAKIQAGLEERYGETIVIQLGTGAVSAGPPPSSDASEVVIPVTPPSPADDGGDNSMSEADTDDGPYTDGMTGYKDTDYGPDSDGITDYGSGDGSYTDGVTDYEDRSVCWAACLPPAASER